MQASTAWTLLAVTGAIALVALLVALSGSGVLDDWSTFLDDMGSMGS